MINLSCFTRVISHLYTFIVSYNLFHTKKDALQKGQLKSSSTKKTEQKIYSVTIYIILNYLFWFHCWKQDNFFDRNIIGEKHYQTIYSNTKPTCWRHSIFQSFQKIFINYIGFHVTHFT